MPELKKSVADVEVTFEEKKVLGERIFAILMKVVYAFVF